MFQLGKFSIVSLILCLTCLISTPGFSYQRSAASAKFVVDLLATASEFVQFSVAAMVGQEIIQKRNASTPAPCSPNCDPNAKAISLYADDGMNLALIAMGLNGAAMVGDVVAMEVVSEKHANRVWAASTAASILSVVVNFGFIMMEQSLLESFDSKSPNDFSRTLTASLLINFVPFLLNLGGAALLAASSFRPMRSI